MNFFDLFGESTVWAGFIGLLIGFIFALVINIK